MRHALDHETNESRLAKDRIRNASAGLRSDLPGDKLQVGTQGAIALALLDVANAIRERDDERSRRLLNISDMLVDAITDGASEETIKGICQAYTVESRGFNVDQHAGMQWREFMR